MATFISPQVITEKILFGKVDKRSLKVTTDQYLMKCPEGRRDPIHEAEDIFGEANVTLNFDLTEI